MHRLGHWFKDTEKGSECELCGLVVVYRKYKCDADLIGHQLAKAGQCPIKDKEEICRKLGMKASGSTAEEGLSNLSNK